MLRFLAGVACCFLLMTGAFLIWQSRAEQAPGLPAAPTSTGSSWFGSSEPLKAPEADPKTREQKRFSRYDKNKDGKVEEDEYLAARRRNFDKLDVDHNGALSVPGICLQGDRQVQCRRRAKGLADRSRVRHHRPDALDQTQGLMQLPGTRRRTAADRLGRQ